MSSNRSEDIDIEVEVITPVVAEKYLAHNVHNRNIRQRVVRGYAGDMRCGRWQLNGEAIKFDSHGNLVDGQHRLLAVIESQTDVQMAVVRGVSDAAQATMDTLIPRKFSDILTLRGEQDAVTLAAAIRSIWTWQQGTRLFRGADLVPTTAQLLAFFADNEWIRAEIPLIRGLSKNVKLPASISGALVYAFNVIDAEDAEFFFRRLMSDEGHKMGDPIFTLRRALLASDDVRGQRNLRHLAAITCKAWNKFRDGDECRMLRFTPGGANAEPFPEPV